MQNFELSTVSLIVLALLGAAKPAVAQATKTLAESGPAPVDDALEFVEKQTGNVITYEDPEFIFEGDLIDVTARIRSPDALHPPGKRYRIVAPRSSSISVIYEVDADGKPIDVSGLVELIAEAGSVGGVQFKAWSGSRRFHVAPVAQRDANGDQVPFVSALDEKISFQAATRSGFQFIGQICVALQQLRQRPFVLNVLASELDKVVVTRGVSGEKARDTLESFLTSVDAQLTWKLRCAPEQECVLNIARVSSSAMQTRGLAK